MAASSVLDTAAVVLSLAVLAGEVMVLVLVTRRSCVGVGRGSSQSSAEDSPGSSFVERVSPIVGAFLLFLCTLFLVEAFVAPVALMVNYVRVSNLRGKLPEAKLRWQSREITDYDVVVEVMVPFCIFEATLVVRNGDIVEVVSDEPGPFFEFVCREARNYEQYLVSEMHNAVERDLDTIDVRLRALQVSFDPDLGYVTYYQSDDCYRFAAGECVREYRFRDLRSRE